MERNFREMLEARWAAGKFVCVGLDSELERVRKIVGGHLVPDVAIGTFNERIIEATRKVACAYKPNVAFYESLGNTGMKALAFTISTIRNLAPEIPIILDAKRADIGSTNDGYVKAAFDVLDADAITVHPYLGMEAMAPFLQREDKGIFVLCRTSNPGAGEFQDLPVDGKPLYQHVAQNVAEKWNKNGNCGLVVGATYPEEMAKVRAIVGDLPLLIPGIGAQGGDLEATVKAGKDSRGRGMIINSSRGIIFAENPEKEAEALNDQIKSFL